MRPVERGPAPQTYTRYQDAIEDLELRLGFYCSYCERRLPVSLAVEHVAPKVLQPELETEWTNFLLGCTNCNSVKGDQAVEIENLLWPFDAYPEIKKAFIQVFPGTAISCFDPDGKPVNRPGRMI